MGLIDLSCLKAVSVYKQSNHGVVQRFRLRKADCFAGQPLDPCAQKKVLVLYFLRVPLANHMLFFGD